MQETNNPENEGTLYFMGLILSWWGFPGGAVLKNPQPMQEMWVQSLNREDLWEREMATHSSILVENSMDRGAWWATVYGVIKSQTQLSHWACTHNYLGSKTRKRHHKKRKLQTNQCHEHRHKNPQQKTRD